ncbi:MAG TPA: flagellar hook-basal body complex protein [Solirubrobacter sp.]|nr:flagellar hook-basal body complex protein [Solirubrobacter sp.]
MFAAISGLKQHQVMLDVTANDISNVNTLGYKSSRVTFQDSLTQMQRGAAGPQGNNGGSNAAQIGLGVGLGSVDNLMTGGAVQTTGNPLDVAIQGDGFFQIGEGAPNPANPLNPITPTAYTRAGNFSINSQGFLITQTGQYVIGYQDPGGTTETAIVIPPGATGVAIDQSGGVSYIDPVTQTRVTPYRLTLATFSNSAGLEREGGNRWIVSANSGTKTVATPGQNGLGVTTAGAVEMSNVDLAQTFTSMITAQRGFQANSRVISTADEMLQDLVNLKR